AQRFGTQKPQLGLGAGSSVRNACPTGAVITLMSCAGCEVSLRTRWAVAGVDERLPGRDDVRGAGRIVGLVVGELALRHGDEDRTRVLVPAGRAARSVVVL